MIKCYSDSWSGERGAGSREPDSEGKESLTLERVTDAEMII